MPLGTAGALALGTVGSSLIGGRAAKKAANAQSQAADNLLRFQENEARQQRRIQREFNDRLFDVNSRRNMAVRRENQARNNRIIAGNNRRNDLGGQFYADTRAGGANQIGVGNDALNMFARLSGIGGDATGALTSMPGYQFRLEEGQKALERNAAARGIRMSGGTMKDFMRFGQGLASDQLGQERNALARLIGYGENARNRNLSAGNSMISSYTNPLAGTNHTFSGTTNPMAGMTAPTGPMLSGAPIAAGGDARASGYIGFANSLNAGANNLFGILGAQKAGYFDDNQGLFGGR